MTIDPVDIPKNPKAEDLVPILTILQDHIVALERRISELEHPRRFSPRDDT